jgi:hypothetical protein
MLPLACNRKKIPREVIILKIFSSLTGLLCSVVMIVLITPPPAHASSQICGGCAAAIVGTAVGVTAGVIVGVYFIHRSHTSLTGCVQPTGNGFSLTTQNGDNYELINASSDINPHRRLLLRGHKVKTTSGRGFRVDHLSRDYGVCTP